MKTAALALLVLAAAASRASADASAGAEYTTGADYRGWDAKASLDLDDKGTNSLSAEYARVHSTAGTETKSNQVVVGLTHATADDWQLRTEFTGWKDDVSGVRYAGPSIGYNYSIYSDESALAEDKSDKLRHSGEPDWIVDFNTDLFYYQSAVNSSSSTITLGRGKSAQRVVVPPTSGAVELLQLHPNLEVDKPLFGARVTPSITVGHYFYSKDPDLIEQRAGQPLFASSAGNLSGLVGGLMLNNGQLGLEVRLPWTLKVQGTLGLEQLATDHTWSTTQGATLTATLFDRAKALVAWSRSIQGGVAQDLMTGGLTWLF